MKKSIYISSILLLLNVTLFAQAAKPKLSANDILMCDKEWHVVAVEEWGVVAKPPADKNKTDMLKMTQDGKYNLIMFGIAHTGTWSKSGATINFVDETSKLKIGFKVLSVDATTLKVDHYSDEDGHSMFEYN